MGSKETHCKDQLSTLYKNNNPQYQLFVTTKTGSQTCKYNRCFKKGAAASTKPTSIVLGNNRRKKWLENRLSLPSTVRSSSCTYYDLGSIGRVFHPSSCIFFHCYQHCCVKRNKKAWTHLHSNIKHKGVDQWYIMPGTSPNSIAW